MHLLHLSDTHSRHRELTHLPKTDVIIHSGDMCYAGTADELSDFLDWFCALDYPCKIFIAGNHDCVLHNADAEKLQLLLPDNVAYLCNSGVEIEGVKFWGVPFMLEMQENYRQELEKIPHNIDVLITYNPPIGVLDYSENIHYGSLDLLRKVQEIKPKYHLFGHIHDNYGICRDAIKGTINRAPTTFVNAAIVNENYVVRNECVVIDI